MTELEIKTKINELIAYACDNLSLKSDDEYYVLNLLLDFFHFNAPAPSIDNYGDFQTTIIDPIVDYAIEKGMIEKDEAMLFETKIMGMVTPMPSQIVEDFDIIATNKGIKKATDWLFRLCKANNYLRMPDINKNIKWHHDGKLGPIDITINLSKPEKDPKQIQLAKLMPQTGYPACMLCATNVGFAGNITRPARQTLRIIPIEIGKEPWALQF
ncbi:MAG: galactose-1-phosphate uridylyltransferase, partial [Clostridia bacterium]